MNNNNNSNTTTTTNNYSKKESNTLLEDFYIRHAESLKAIERPTWLCLCLFAVETLYMFSLLLITSYLTVDQSGEIFTTLSIHCLSTLISEVVVIVILALNVFILGSIVYMFICFCQNPHNRLRIALLPFSIMNYNICFLIPSILLSTKIYRANELDIIPSLCVVNLALTLIVSALCSLYSMKSYSFFSTKGDSMAKFGSIWDCLKHPVLSISMIVIEGLNKQQGYTYLVFIYCAINMCDFLLKNTFYQRIVDQAFTAQQFNLLCISLIIEIQLRGRFQSQLTAVVIFLCTTLPLSWVVGRKIVYTYYLKLNESIDKYITEAAAQRNGVLSSSSSSQNQVFTPRERDYYLDYFTRTLLEKTVLFKKNQKLMLSLFNQTTHFSEQEDVAKPNKMNWQDHDDDSSNNNIGSLIDNKEKIAVKSSKIQVKQLLHYFHSKERHNSNLESSSDSMWELFYLLEIEGNLPKLAIQIQKYLYRVGSGSGKNNRNKNLKIRSIRQLALVKQLQDQLERRESILRKQMQMSEYSNNARDMHTITSSESTHNDSDFSTAFEFQEEIQLMEESIMKALKLKLDFLNGISENTINLQGILETGSQLMVLIKSISLMVVNLKSKSINCIQLSQLTRIFVDCLWIDPNDFKFKLIRKFQINNNNDQFAKQSQHHYMHAMNNLTSLHHHKIDFNELNREHCVILVSLSDKSFGKIVKVSDSCYDITGYSQVELINQNCGIIQPAAIGMHHNSMLRRGVDTGIQRSYLSKTSPLIVKHKDGLGVKVQIQIQMSIMHTAGLFSDIGFIGKLVLNEARDNYILFDVSQSRARIEVVSQNIYDCLLGYYFNSPHEINGKELGQMVPIAFSLNKYMKAKQQITSEIAFDSLIFLPIGSNEYSKRRLFDPSSNLLMSAQKRYYNRQQNDIFLAKFTAVQYEREGEYQLILLKIHDFRQIDDELESICRNQYTNHLTEFTGLSNMASTSIVDSILTLKTQNQIDENNMKQFEEISSTQEAVNLYVKSVTPLQQPSEQLNEETMTQAPGKYLQNSFIGMESLSLTSPIKGGIEREAIDNSGALEQLLKNSGRNTVIRSQLDYLSSTTDRLQLLSESKVLESVKQHNHQQQSSRYFMAKPRESSSEFAVKTLVTSRRRSSMRQPEISNNVKNYAQKEEVLSESDQNHRAVPNQNNYNIKSKKNLLHYRSSMSRTNKHFIRYSSTTNNAKQESHRGSITSQQSSQVSTQLRDALFRGIGNQQNSSLQLNLMHFITASFLSIILIVCFVYLNIRKQISTQELSFQFSWWQDKIQDSSISILRLTEADAVFRFTRLGGNSSTELNTFKNSITNTTKLLYDDCITQFDSLNQHDYSDLYLIELLYSTQMPYLKYIDKSTSYNKTYNMLQVLQVYSYSAYQFSRRMFSMRTIVELEIVMNMDNIASMMEAVTTRQVQSENELVQTMKSQVFLSLIFILSLCSFIACIMLPFYWAFQTKKQFILRLFSSIEPGSISAMYSNSSNGILAIHETRLNNTQIRNPIHQNINSSIGSSNSNANLLIKPQIIKTRKNLPTTYLPKIHLKFGLQVLFILLIINVQPFVNHLLISEQVSESETELAIVRSLYQLSTAFVYAEYAIFATTEKTAAPPQMTIVSLSVFETKVYESIAQVKVALAQVQNTIYSLSSQSRYQDSEMGTFINNIFTVNACDALAHAKPSYFYNNGGLIYNNTLCTSVFGGILTKGYFHAMTSFQSKLTQYSEITTSNITSRQKSPLYTKFYTENTPLEMENLFTMIKIAQSAVITCISQDKEQYYASIDLTQLALFFFEVAFVIILFPVAVYPFFVKIKRQMVQVVEIIQVLQIQHIQENSYICHFIKQSHHT